MEIIGTQSNSIKRFNIKIRLIFQVAIVIIVIISDLGVVQSSSNEEDLSLTLSQGKILEQFKQRMLPRLKQDYMRDDIYLIRWLRAKNFNMDEAEKMLLNNLRWRKANRMDNVDKEDWSYFEEEFPYYLDAYDFEGRPILTIDSSKWDVRMAVLSGKRDKLIKWMAKMVEDATKKIRELQAEGKNVTRWGMIYNLGYFNLIQSGCIQCLPVYAEFVNNYESYYPNTVDKMTIVNTPSIFEVVLQLIRPLMTSGTRSALRVFGANKSQWQKALFDEIPRDQLTKEYGGTRVRDN